MDGALRHSESLGSPGVGLELAPGIRILAGVSVRITSLHIRNLALVEDVTWELARGFTAVTGETGSGKSIIVGALKLILGERADKSLLRTGAESCTVEAVFEVAAPAALNAQLEEQGVEPCEDAQLIIKRAFTATGTNRQFINGSPTTLSVLKTLGEAFVDLHGPHDHQSLLSVEKQLDLLNAFAGAESARAKYSETYRELQRVVAEHHALSTSEAALEREVDLLRHQVHEIEAARLQPEEEEEMLARYSVASNSRRLLELSTQITGRLIDAEDAVLGRLSEIGKYLRDLERVDPAASRFTESHLRAATELEDLAQSLQRYAEELDIDPERLAAMEERVSLFETLKRKYGGSVGEVISFGENAAARLRKIESRGEELERLEQTIAAARKMVATAGAALSKKRTAAAPKLAGSITAQLRDLGFKKSGFSIALTPHTEPGAHGLESVEFLFAPNPGEPEKPLRAIGSSGEISRVMLAVKSSLAAQDTVSLLVFDEIDANVGGEIAHAVGAKMRSLGEKHQVLCISHLPQVAALAAEQFVVTKEFTNQRTISRLEKVEGKARVEEIARMLGGKGESALAHARTLLDAK